MKELSHARSPVETGSLEPQSTLRKADIILPGVMRLPDSWYTPAPSAHEKLFQLPAG